MTSIDLTSYTHEQLNDALRVLQSYRTAQKQIGNRAKLSDPKSPEMPTFVIHYAPGIDKKTLDSWTKSAVHTYFPEGKLDATANYVEDANLIGGIRIFYGDDMVDVSFDRVAHLMH